MATVSTPDDVTTYTAHAHRWARGWELHIDGVGVTQSRTLNDAEAMVRDYIALDKGIAAEPFKVEILPQIEGSLDSEAAAVRQAVAAAEKAQRVAATQSRAVARKLKNAGLTGREIAFFLKISPQRVSQLLRPKDTNVESGPDSALGAIAPVSGASQAAELEARPAFATRAAEPLTSAEREATARLVTAPQAVTGARTADRGLNIDLAARPRPIRVFVAMAFHEDEPTLADYWHAMLRAAAGARRPLELIRPSGIDGDYEIADRIYKEIDSADLVIADLTLSSANVYLELGYARGRRKQVIQTCRSDTRLEFDVRNRRTLIYQNAAMLEHKLLQELNALVS
jgi:hypothetical protein